MLQQLFHQFKQIRGTGTIAINMSLLRWISRQIEDVTARTQVVGVFIEIIAERRRKGHLVLVIIMID